MTGQQILLQYQQLLALFVAQMNIEKSQVCFQIKSV